MLTQTLCDLKEVFCMLRLEPACFDAEILTAAAALFTPDGSSADGLRQLLRQWTPQKLPYIPRWHYDDIPSAGAGRSYGTEADCALLHAILYTAAALRKEEKLTVLSALADAAHNLPEAILTGDASWLCRVHQELEEFRRDHSVTLIHADTTLDHQEE